MTRHQEHREAMPSGYPAPSTGRPDQPITPWLSPLVCFVVLLLALGFLAFLRPGQGDEAPSLTTLAYLSASHGEAEIITPDFNPIDNALAPADTSRHERRPSLRGTPDRGDLAPFILLAGLGLVILRVPWGTRWLENDSPRLSLRVCRARPPTFRC